MIAVLVTTYDGHLPYLARVLEYARRGCDWLIVAWDGGGDPVPDWVGGACDRFVVSGAGAGKQYGELNSIKIGLQTILGLDPGGFTLKITGDDLLEKPEGIRRLPELLGDHYSISINWNECPSTNTFFGVTAKLWNVWQRIAPPFATIERHYMNVLIGTGKRVGVYPIHACRGQFGVWGQVLGFRRLGGNWPPTRAPGRAVFWPDNMDRRTLLLKPGVLS